MDLTARRLNRSTLHRQMLLERRSMSVIDGVRHVVALQAQEAPSPYVALWNRLVGFDPSELDTAFADHSVVKASLMRITLHAVLADDYPAFHEAMTPILRAARLNDRRFHVAGMPIADADGLVDRVLAFASDARTKEEIEAAMADELGEVPHKGLWWAMKTFAPFFHAPTAPPWGFGRRPSYRAAPRGARPDFETSMQHLVRRYLEGFGPASVADFAQFSMHNMGPIRQAFADLGDQLDVLKGPDGSLMYDISGAYVPEEAAVAEPRLMAMWDSALLAYKDRSRIIPEDYRKIVIRVNGDVLPTILVDGYVAGMWRPTEQGIEITAFHELSKTAWEGLENEAHDLMHMLSDREPLIYRRYANWWTKITEGERRVIVGDV